MKRLSPNYETIPFRTIETLERFLIKQVLLGIKKPVNSTLIYVWLIVHSMFTESSQCNKLKQGLLLRERGTKISKFPLSNYEGILEIILCICKSSLAICPHLITDITF